jgi:phospholipid transport system transporter-binding protein
MISCDGERCAVEGSITMTNATATLAEGLQKFTASHVTVDLSRLTEVDSAAVSLLLEWRRAAQRDGRTIDYVKLPDNLKSLAELYGVTDLLGEV